MRAHFKCTEGTDLAVAAPGSRTPARHRERDSVCETDNPAHTLSTRGDFSTEFSSQNMVEKKHSEERERETAPKSH